MNHDHEQNWWYEHLPEEPEEKPAQPGPESGPDPGPEVKKSG
jgi:hypothetical protein